MYIGDSSLLTQSLFSMLYEMDKKIFIGNFILPLLLGLKENVNNHSIRVYMDVPRLAHLLSMLNSIIYGYDEYESIRDLFTFGSITLYLDEINKLISVIKNIQSSLNDDDDFLISEM